MKDETKIVKNRSLDWEYLVSEGWVAKEKREDGWVVMEKLPPLNKKQVDNPQGNR